MNNCLKNSGLLTATAQERIDKLPPVFRYVIGVLVDCIDNIVNGKCDEDTMVSAMGTLQNNASGKFSKDDLLTYDEAGVLLGFGKTNRVGLKRLLDKNGIKQVVFGNAKVGFRRSEIITLKARIENERLIANERRIKSPKYIHI